MKNIPLLFTAQGKNKIIIYTNWRGGPDHDGYILGDSKYSKMGTYINQIKNVLNPAKVNNIKKNMMKITENSLSVSLLLLFFFLPLGCEEKMKVYYYALSYTEREIGRAHV